MKRGARHRPVSSFGGHHRHHGSRHLKGRLLTTILFSACMSALSLLAGRCYLSSSQEGRARNFPERRTSATCRFAIAASTEVELLEPLKVGKETNYVKLGSYIEDRVKKNGE